MLPGMLAGLALSRHVAPYVDRGRTRPAVLTVVALTGAAIVLRELLPGCAPPPIGSILWNCIEFPCLLPRSER